MPNCFTLTRKGETEPTPLCLIDDELCKLIGVEPHPKLYVYGWFDDIGWDLAMGRSFTEIRERLSKMLAQETDKEFIEVREKLLTMAEYLEENFLPDAWYQVGK